MIIKGYLLAFFTFLVKFHILFFTTFSAIIIRIEKVGKMAVLKECDLYEPIKAFFIENGYKVAGEVKDIDMVATKDDDLIAIELKATFNLKLILQAIDRQKMFDTVYVAIFKPNKVNKRYKEIVHLLKRLEVGLITVSLLKSGTRVTIEHHPLTYNRKVNHRRKKSVIREIDNRSGIVDNLGGTSKVKRITAYRETSIAIAVALDILGDSSPKRLKTLTEIDKTGNVLYQNHYGWFDRIGQGLYGLTSKGRQAIDDYKEISDYFIKTYQERTSNETQ